MFERVIIKGKRVFFCNGGKTFSASFNMAYFLSLVLFLSFFFKGYTSGAVVLSCSGSFMVNWKGKSVFLRKAQYAGITHFLSSCLTTLRRLKNTSKFGEDSCPLLMTGNMI